MNAGKDPYFLNYYRINFDGSGLTPLTTGDGNHNVVFSEDGKLYVDTWSRVDAPPISELHKTADASLVMPLEKGDIADLQAAGWKPPEVFVAKARDGTTDIWGVIYRPTNFSAAKKYPVIENIYAGPQGSFVPKSFARVQRDAGHRRARLHRRADRRHGHVEPLEGVPRRRVEEPRRRRLPRSHPVAQGGRREVSLLRHQPRRHLRHVGRRAERARRAALPRRLLQGRRVGLGLPRQPHGQDLVERAVDGMADRPASTAPRRTSTTPRT